jgi:leucine dehydrogenase
MSISTLNSGVKSTENPIISQMSTMGHDQILFCSDNETGLKAIIAVHDTTLGPALGGTRMWSYSNELEALNDVLRLSRGMTYKNAISNLALGGGKAVIIGDAKSMKSEALFRRFGRFVDSLAGNYITAEDVGISPSDMVWVSQETKHVVGLPGKSGDPSPVTAYGTYMGMKACAKVRYGNDSLQGKKILVQGVGHVGEYLVKYLSKEGAEIFVSDIHEEAIAKMTATYGATRVDLSEVYDINMDIYAPCALGGTLNNETLERLKCEIVAGAANNQLKEEDIHGKSLLEKDILYAPDFAINAGGVINCFSEVEGLSSEWALEKAQDIYATIYNIVKRSQDEKLPSHLIAMQMAQEKIDAAQKSL